MMAQLRPADEAAASGLQTLGADVWVGNQATGQREGLLLLRTKCKGLVSRNQPGDGNQRL